MTQFTDLIDPVSVTKHGGQYADDAKDFTLPGRLQRSAASRFPMLAMRHGFRLWQPPGLKRGPSLRIVVGVSTASRTDMTFLDKLREMLPSIKESGGVVEVFNTYHFQNIEEIEERVPGLGEVHQTPIVGVWHADDLVMVGTGFQARSDLFSFIGPLPTRERMAADQVADERNLGRHEQYWRRDPQ